MELFWVSALEAFARQLPVHGAAIGWTQEDGARAPGSGTTVDANMADPDQIAETYLQLHCQHLSTWAF